MRINFINLQCLQILFTEQSTWYALTCPICSGVSAPGKSCLFASINSVAPASRYQQWVNNKGVLYILSPLHRAKQRAQLYNLRASSYPLSRQPAHHEHGCIMCSVYPNETVCALKIVPPVRPQRLLSPNIPEIQLIWSMLEGFDVEPVTGVTKASNQHAPTLKLEKLYQCLPHWIFWAQWTCQHYLGLCTRVSWRSILGKLTAVHAQDKNA